MVSGVMESLGKRANRLSTDSKYFREPSNRAGDIVAGNGGQATSALHAEIKRMPGFQTRSDGFSGNLRCDVQPAE
eukprot:3192663-Amphidinium_carterae.1